MTINLKDANEVLKKLYSYDRGGRLEANAYNPATVLAKGSDRTVWHHEGWSVVHKTAHSPYQNTKEYDAWRLSKHHLRKYLAKVYSISDCGQLLVMQYIPGEVWSTEFDGTEWGSNEYEAVSLRFTTTKKEFKAAAAGTGLRLSDLHQWNVIGKKIVDYGLTVS